MNTIESVRMDKSAFAVRSLDDSDPDRDYWRSKTPAERLEALELMRQIMYGYDPTSARLQRVLTVAELSSR
ncbi:MAG: hypothetical protein AAB676_15340 [Verrucomicrobiota bacterium]